MLSRASKFGANGKPRGACEKVKEKHMNFRSLVLILSAFVMSAQAHPGHDLMAHGAGHVATSVYHLWVLCAVALVSFGVGQMVRTAASRRVLRTAGVMALLAAGTLWGFGL
jgi:hypothetical protein